MNDRKPTKVEWAFIWLILGMIAITAVILFIKFITWLWNV